MSPPSSAPPPGPAAPAVKHAGPAPTRSRRPAHPVADRVRSLVPEAARSRTTCPRCRYRASAATLVDHLLVKHDATPADVAAWLETLDRDLFALAIHCLIAQPATWR